MLFHMSTQRKDAYGYVIYTCDRCKQECTRGVQLQIPTQLSFYCLACIDFFVDEQRHADQLDAKHRSVVQCEEAVPGNVEHGASPVREGQQQDAQADMERSHEHETTRP